jgi:hypothetical protein
VDGLAIATGFLALATFLLAGLTWWDIRGNKQLIAEARRQADALVQNLGIAESQVTSLRRQSDLLWENAIPYLIPTGVENLAGTTMQDMRGWLTVSYAAGTIPAQAVDAWVGSAGLVWTGGDDLLTSRDTSKMIGLVQSRAGHEPPIEWNEWLRRDQKGVEHRVVMRWVGPTGNTILRAWWFSWGRWAEVPEALR